MKSNHISYIMAIATTIRAITAGEKPVIAIRTCFAMRRLVNRAYSAGITPEELADMIEH